MGFLFKKSKSKKGEELLVSTAGVVTWQILMLVAEGGFGYNSMV